MNAQNDLRNFTDHELQTLHDDLSRRIGKAQEKIDDNKRLRVEIAETLLHLERGDVFAEADRLVSDRARLGAARAEFFFLTEEARLLSDRRSEVTRETATRRALSRYLRAIGDGEARDRCIEAIRPWGGAIVSEVLARSAEPEKPEADPEIADDLEAALDELKTDHAQKIGEVIESLRALDEATECYRKFLAVFSSKDEPELMLSIFRAVIEDQTWGLEELSVGLGYVQPGDRPRPLTYSRLLLRVSNAVTALQNRLVSRIPDDADPLSEGELRAAKVVAEIRDRITSLTAILPGIDE